MDAGMPPRGIRPGSITTSVAIQSQILHAVMCLKVPLHVSHCRNRAIFMARNVCRMPTKQDKPTDISPLTITKPTAADSVCLEGEGGG